MFSFRSRTLPRKQAAYNPEQLVPSDPNIIECPSRGYADKLTTPIDQVELTTLEYPARYRDKDIIAVVGPISCNRCMHRCSEAYITISSWVTLSRMDERLKHSEAPVNIPLFNNAAEQSPNVVGNEAKKPATESRIFGSEARSNQLVDTILDLQQAAIVSTSPDGRIALHLESFQQELSIGHDQRLGQLKLF